MANGVNSTINPYDLLMIQKIPIPKSLIEAEENHIEEDVIKGQSPFG
jgi:Serine carboxypeptidase